jgi:hypothetical protein
MPAAAMLEAIDSSQSAAEKAARARRNGRRTVQLLGTLSFQAHVTEIFETVENELLSVDGKQAGDMGVTEAGVKARCVIPPAYGTNSSLRR